MFRIEDNVIYITKGDSATIHVKLRDMSGAEYKMREGDKLKLSVAEFPHKLSSVRIYITSDTNDIELKPNDTKSLGVGQYSADIQLSTADGRIFTIFPDYSDDPGKLKDEKKSWKNFWVTPEVTQI